MPYADPEVRKAFKRRYAKTYLERNKETINEYNKKWREANPLTAEQRKLYYARQKERVAKDPCARMWRSLKTKAKKLNIPFNIEVSDIVIPTHCPMLGVELTFGVESGLYCSPSVDRIIPNLGYVKGNIQIISQRANRIKTDATPEELMKVAKFMEKL